MPESRLDHKQSLSIEDLLVKHQLITQGQLFSALAELGKTNKKLSQILVDANYISEVDLLKFTSEQLNIPYVDISEYACQEEVMKLLPESLARRFHVLVLENHPDHVVLAMTDPTDATSFAELTHILQKTIRPVLVKKFDLLIKTNQAYGKAEFNKKLEEKQEKSSPQLKLEPHPELKAEDTSELKVERRKRIRIEDMLVLNNLITQEQLFSAIAELGKTDKKLTRILVDLNYIKELDLLSFTAQQLNIPYLDISQYSWKAEVVRALPENVARRFRVLLLENNNYDVLVAMADPADLISLDELSRVFKKTIRAVLVKESDLVRAIDQAYRRTDEIKVLAEQLRYELADNDTTDLNVLLAADKSIDAPVVRLLKSVFEDAVQVRASDIHIEPQEHKLLIRFRIDGQMQPQTDADLKISAALVQKLKLMAGLDISEKRLPHDGRFHIKVRQQPVDVRISTMPTVYGESLVMRLLIQNVSGFSLEKQGMPAEILSRFRNLIHRSSGMVLLTGPTGSGKSTTLYAAVSERNATSKKIITVEDRVEYRLPGINQVQVNDKIDCSFARVLRSVLRQDPDIILIGEMRDQETAQIAMRAAMTGHLVLSTLHTNDTISTPSRLIDMGVEAFVVATSLLAIIAQRLLRLVCENCAEPYYPDAFERAWLELELGEEVDKHQFVIGKGCSQCNNTGYRGRVAVYSLLEMNNQLTDAISHHDIRDFRELAQQQMSGKTLRYSAIQLAVNKRTTVAEAMWVSNQFE